MREVSYGRIRLSGDLSRVNFANKGQETGLVCLHGTCQVRVGGESFTMTRDDALYIPKGLSIEVQTASEVDLVECSAPVEDEYPLQFVSAEAARKNEKLHFVAGTPSAHREINILLGSNIRAGKLVVGITRSLPGNWPSWPPHEHASGASCRLIPATPEFDPPRPVFSCGIDQMETSVGESLRLSFQFAINNILNLHKLFYSLHLMKLSDNLRYRCSKRI